MVVNEDLLKKLEKLSSLKLKDELRSEFIGDFSDILKFVENLNEINTDDLIINTNEHTPLRNDEILKSDVIDDILKHSPASKEHFFSVPKIIE